MPKHLFSQVDVFCGERLRGNPVAVVHDALDDDGAEIDAGLMQAFARWTNLSETTFLLPPTDPGADYRLRIFTPAHELPFAGHPTLGSARAWLATGGVPRTAGVVVQQCGAGLVRVRRREGALAFAAPALLRSGPPENALRRAVTAALRVEPSAVVDSSWLVNGPRWLGLLLRDAATVLALRPDFGAIEAIGEVEVGVIGPHGPEAEADYEVRAFCPGAGVDEDPVTGSLQAGLAQWLTASGRAPDRYVAAQGSVVGRAGRVSVELDRDPGQGRDVVWVGGETVLRVAGAVDLT
ncbi:MAG TPA: PhzF family phenazine biosynthesis protein [Ornithinimicrobium sp.]|uniref:PhzF family phenazine biosynthesis protein n=1 Tax=Ornithinimicrobium sp. TaxID=1977084 RepID=UPI002B48BE14|nr:PhzF family phenazine biosynthesis protein [Ornithinimicrobium sp.]HKJ11457.1 PhzF family phenazine biosynthesis protein [Ornithinimicrobium sp.]